MSNENTPKHTKSLEGSQLIWRVLYWNQPKKERKGNKETRSDAKRIKAHEKNEKCKLKFQRLLMFGFVLFTV